MTSSAMLEVLPKAKTVRIPNKKQGGKRDKEAKSRKTVKKNRKETLLGNFS